MEGPVPTPNGEIKIRWMKDYQVKASEGNGYLTFVSNQNQLHPWNNRKMDENHYRLWIKRKE